MFILSFFSQGIQRYFSLKNSLPWCNKYCEGFLCWLCWLNEKHRYRRKLVWMMKTKKSPISGFKAFQMTPAVTSLDYHNSSYLTINLWSFHDFSKLKWHWFIHCDLTIWAFLLENCPLWTISRGIISQIASNSDVDKLNTSDKSAKS